MNNTSALEHKRHSLAHLLAAAVLEIYPKAKPTIGPAIDKGFYYDFDDLSITEKDLGKIEQKMRELVKSWKKFDGKEVTEKEARAHFKSNPYKLELIDDLAKEKQKITFYTSGTFTDLCRGGHSENPSKDIAAGSWKLDRTAGAYWRGSEKNKMLTRIYGLAFDTKEELEGYEKMMAEAEKRDHRKLGKDLELFMISDEVGKGLPLWLPNGAFIRKKLEDYMYEKELERGYKYVYTPVLTHKRLYERSGHLAHYRDDMYNPIMIEGEEYFLKPMNCPHHHQIYNFKPHSYRDLPVRLAEFGLVHRFERSGVLTGLIRARCFTQNDSHIYTRRSDLKKELIGVLELFKTVYDDFKIKDFWYRLSLPDFNNSEKFGDVKNRDMWNEAGKIAEETLKEFGVKYVVGVGEASFYGPKIDVQIKNALGKEDTIATAQIDFYSAPRFDLTFANEKGEKEPVVIIHRAIMGSFDRFFAFLVEQTAGHFPLWLSPVQAVFLPVSGKHEAAAREALAALQKAGIRAELSDATESLGKRVRNLKLQKIPYWLVIGDKDVAANAATLEGRDKQYGQLSVAEILKKLTEEVTNKK